MTHLGASPTQTGSVGSTSIKVLNPDVTNVVGESVVSITWDFMNRRPVGAFLGVKCKAAEGPSLSSQVFSPAVLPAGELWHLQRCDMDKQLPATGWGRGVTTQGEKRRGKSCLKGGGADNQQLLGQGGGVGVGDSSVRMYTCVCMCVGVAVCQAVPSGCLTELFSLTGRLIAVAAPSLCQTSPRGHEGNRHPTCLWPHWRSVCLNVPNERR